MIRGLEVSPLSPIILEVERGELGNELIDCVSTW